MSIDLCAVTRKKVNTAKLCEIAVQAFGESNIRESIDSIEVSTCKELAQKVFLYFEKANIDTLPDSVIKVVGKPEWVYTLSTSSLNVDIKKLSQIIINVAQAGDGLVFDLGTEKVEFLSPSISIITNEHNISKEKKINLVTFQFFFTPEQPDKLFAKNLITFLEKKLKDGLPKSFHDLIDTKKTKVLKSDYSNFLATWEKFFKQEITNVLFWNGQTNNIEGSIHFADKRPRQDTEPYYISTTCLTFKFDSNLFSGHSAQIFFQNMCQALNPFYACGYVMFDLLIKGKTLFFDTDKDQRFFINNAGKWQGIPQQQVWICWLGKDYQNYLENEVLELTCAKEEFPSGTFISLGISYMSKEELKVIPLLFPRKFIMPTKDIPNFDNIQMT